jgi:hypothetical protein
MTKWIILPSYILFRSSRVQTSDQRVLFTILLSPHTQMPELYTDWLIEVTAVSEFAQKN